MALQFKGGAAVPVTKGTVDRSVFSKWREAISSVTYAVRQANSGKFIYGFHEPHETDIKALQARAGDIIYKMRQDVPELEAMLKEIDALERKYA